MRHVRKLGLCIVAIFVAAAFAATSASALPEFGKCEVQPSHEGRYTESNCVKKAKKVNEKFTGEFEFKKASEIEATKRHFLGIGGAGTLDAIYTICSSEEVRAEKCREGEEEHFFLSEPGKPVKIECESEENHGEISGAKTVARISVVFHGCKLFGSSPCSNTVNQGEIQVNTLKGKIGWINKGTTPREVGLLLEPNVKRGEFAKFTCLEGLIGTVVGEGDEAEGCAYPLPGCGGDGIIGAMTPVNTNGSAFTQTFTANEETAEQIPSKFEGTAPLKQLESYVFNVERPEGTTKWSKAAESVVNGTTLCAEPPENRATECPGGKTETGEIKAN